MANTYVRRPDCNAVATENRSLFVLCGSSILGGLAYIDGANRPGQIAREGVVVVVVVVGALERLRLIMHARLTRPGLVAPVAGQTERQTRQFFLLTLLCS